MADWTVERFEAGIARIRRVFQRTDQLLEEGNVENPKAIPERVGMEVIENVAREDREELFEWWARLLVGSARGNDVDSYHVDTVKKLNPDSARVLNAVGYQLADFPKFKKIQSPDDLKNSYIAFHKALANACQVEPVRAGIACVRLVALGLVEYTDIPTPGHPLIFLTGFGEHLLHILYPDQLFSRVETPPLFI